MKWTSREIILAWITFAAILLGVTVWLGDPKLGEWRDSLVRADTLTQRIAAAQRLVEYEDTLHERLDHFRRQLPHHGPEERVTAGLMRTLEELARENDLSLLRREPQEEKELDDLSEVSIACTWEGDLEALVHFLYAVHLKGVMMDVRLLHIAPARSGASRGRLQGSFTVDCAFSRGSEPGRGDMTRDNGSG